MNHGKKTENILEKICFNIFSPDLVAKSPVVHEETGDKELTDILIYLGDEILIFQSKSIDIEASELDGVKEGRLYKKIKKATHQFSTTLSAKRHNIDASFINGVGIRSKIDWKKVKVNSGIIIINIKDKKYLDPEFRTSFPFAVTKYQDIDVHIFILRDLYNMKKDLSTPYDFIRYLNDRKEAFKHEIMWAGNELDFLAYLKTHYDKWTEIKNGKSEFDMIALPPGLWEDYINNEELNKMKINNLKDSYPFDDTLTMLKETIKYSIDNQIYSKNTAIKNYEIFITLLSKLCRVQRRDISRKWEEKFINTKTKHYSYFLSVYQDIDLSILFLVCNEKEREKRQNSIINFCIAAAQIIDTKRLIGITTAGYDIQYSGFDFIINTDISDLKKETPVVDPKLLFKPKENITSIEWENQNG